MVVTWVVHDHFILLMQPRKVTAEELEVELANRDVPMVVDFYATWCFSFPLGRPLPPPLPPPPPPPRAGARAPAHSNSGHSFGPPRTVTTQKGKRPGGRAAPVSKHCYMKWKAPRPEWGGGGGRCGCVGNCRRGVPAITRPRRWPDSAWGAVAQVRALCAARQGAGDSKANS